MTEKVEKKELVPKLRFPGFQGEWEALALGETVSIISERVGNQDCIPLSVTSGIGLVSQVEKFGRTIAGSQYKNYIKLQTGDFAYNKSATKADPQGFVARYNGTDLAAVPSSIFTCFRADAKLVDPRLLKYFFEANIHGNFLQRRLTIGARANGSLNIADADLLETPIPLPRDNSALTEQRKIAECLESLDELIAAETEKLEALKRHKKGLLQQLFPAEGETTPRLRFPQLSIAGDWLQGSIGMLGEVVTGNTPSTANRAFYGRDVWFASPVDIFGHRLMSETANGLSALGSQQARLVPPGSTLFVCIGSTIGKVAQNAQTCATNQQINSVVPDTSRFDQDFVYYLLLTKTSTVRELAGKQAVPLVSKSVFSSVEIMFPLIDEQRAIATLLNELDHVQSAAHYLCDRLRAHKAALMQQLFPSLEELDAPTA